MAWSRRRFAIFTCVLGTAALAIGIGVATGAKLKTKSATTSIKAASNGAATAKCKRGSEAVSGGFDTPDFDTTYLEASIWTIDSKREGKRKWTSAGHNFGGAAGELVSFAYCDRSEPRLKAKSQSVTVPGGVLGFGSATATAKCKRGSEAVAGGAGVPEFDVTGGEVVLVKSRREGKRKWAVTGANDGPTDGELVAFAYCDKSEPGLKTKSMSTDLDPYPDTGRATTNCKEGRQAVSGGFAGDFDPSGLGAVILPLASKRDGKRKWTATGYNDSSGAGGEFVAYVYCAKKKQG
jgi:hypothetical protein